MKQYKADRKWEIKNQMLGGVGSLEMRHFLNKEDAYGAGRLFAVNTLHQGASIGYHQHDGEYEVYLILEGTARIVEDGEVYLLNEGDMMQCADGSSHSIENVGCTPLRFLALILNVYPTAEEKLEDQK